MKKNDIIKDAFTVNNFEFIEDPELVTLFENTILRQDGTTSQFEGYSTSELIDNNTGLYKYVDFF